MAVLGGMDVAPVPVAGASGRLAAWRKLGLAAEVLLVYRRARRSFGHNDLRRTVANVRPDSAPAVDGYDRTTYLAGLRYGRAVSQVLDALPLDSRCLMQSVVLTGMLARRGIHGEVVIGVRPGEDFGAHAWVELGGRPLLPPHDYEFDRLLAI